MSIRNMRLKSGKNYETFKVEEKVYKLILKAFSALIKDLFVMRIDVNVKIAT